jgi:hypothetical protein
MGLTSFSPTSSYPGFDPYRYVYLVRAVQDCLHPFDHRLLQPALGLFALILAAMDDHLVVANKDRHSPRTLVSTLPQQGQRQLQAIGCGSLDRRVEAVGQLLDVRAASAGERNKLLAK